MDVMHISGDTQANILNIVAGILHLGNIAFSEDGNYAIPEDDGCEFKVQGIAVVIKTLRSMGLYCMRAKYWVMHFQLQYM